MEQVDWSALHKILNDATRRNILELLVEKDALSYTEIMVLLQVTNTGRLNYHLKALGALISKDDQGKYHLTEKGALAANLLKTFPERAPAENKTHQSGLRMVVAIGLLLVGILLISAVIGIFLALISSSPPAESASVSSSSNSVGYLSFAIVPLPLGIAMIALSLLILTHRVWR
ncbi:MAG: helix-turn-helix domain-containing protein [Candidatus Bathyarchaeota archaeon]|nr:helix-turn-helix domain-containing protein [Candidatus Bathyarchaeota archaeon]